METIIKKTRELGTSAGVLLPRSWLNKRVVVTLSILSKEEIIKDVIGILLENELNEDVKGIYLFGSYARNEQDYESDIDVLVITEKTNKLISKDNYEINLVSEGTLSKNLPNNLYYQSILKEIEIILNKSLIEKYYSKNYKKDFKKNLGEIKRIIKINKESIETSKELKKNIPDGIIYSLVLRLRELYLIKCLPSNTIYSKNKFVKLIGEKVYSAYTRVKRNEKELNNISPTEAEKLISLSEKWLKELKD